MRVPTQHEAERVVDKVFGARARLVVLHGWHLSFLVSTEFYRRINGAELEQLWTRLGVSQEQVEFWDKTDGAENTIEFSIDLDPVTPLER